MARAFGGGMNCPHQYVYSLGAGEGHCLRCHSLVQSTGVYGYDSSQIDSDGMAQETYERHWRTVEEQGKDEVDKREVRR